MKMKDEHANLLAQELRNLCHRFKDQTGEDILIGYAFTDEESQIEGAASSEDLDWNTACSFCVGITSRISDFYGRGVNKD